MITKTQLPIRFTGLLYFVDNIDIGAKTNFTKELKKAKEEDDEPWVLGRCSLIQDKIFIGEKLIFDIDLKDYYERYFVGFLYDNGKVSGKIKWTRDVNLPYEIINGKYTKINKNKIILCGNWEDDSTKTNFVIELISLKDKPTK
jgi:hypothetical protein